MGPSDWERWVEGIIEFLSERARLERQTSYTEVNAVVSRRWDLAPLDFDNPRDRSAMSHMLREVVIRFQQQSGTNLMLTSIVIYLNENGPGAGFYALAVELGLLRRGATADQQLEFWIERVTAVFDHFKI